MSIFKRKRDDAADRSDEVDTDPSEAGSGLADGDDVSAAGSGADARSAGPWDVEEVHGRDGRIDLGALWLRGTAGLELRLEVDKESQQVAAATAVLGDSALQVQAFAAPRSVGLWDEIRGEIAQAVEKQGGTAEEHEGSLGTALRARVPSTGPDKRTVFAPTTFVGVDGPRWFLRGVLSGRAAIDEAAAAPLLEVFREVVVVRGVDPMAPREMLPLTLPRDVEPAGAGGADDDEDEDEAGPTRPASDLDPFERGPEITEVR